MQNGIEADGPNAFDGEPRWGRKPEYLITSTEPIIHGRTTAPHPGESDFVVVNRAAKPDRPLSVRALTLERDPASFDFASGNLDRPLGST